MSTIRILAAVSTVVATLFSVSSAQEAQIRESDRRSEGVGRSPILIDRVLRNAPNPEQSDPNVVDGFRLADGTVVYFDSSQPGTLQRVPYAEFVEENPLFEIPLPTVDQQRIAASAADHTTTISMNYTWDGDSFAVSFGTAESPGHIFGCDIEELAIPQGAAEPIYGLSPQFHQRTEIGTAGRGINGNCRYYNYKHADDELTPANSVVAMMNRNARIEITSYSTFPDYTGQISYPREFEDYIAFGDVVSFSDTCPNARYLKVNVEFDYGVAGVHFDGVDLRADRDGHLQGRRPDTYAATHIMRRCDAGSASGSVTMRLRNYNQASVAELRTAPDYNPNGLPPYNGEAYLSGMFHRCGAIDISGGHSAGTVAITRQGVGACSPESNSPRPQSNDFKVRTPDGTVPAIFGTALNNYNLLGRIRHNPRFGVMVARDTNDRILFYYNDRFHLWHNVNQPVNSTPVSYLTRVAASPSSNPSSPTAPSEAYSNCRVDVIGGIEYACSSDQGQIGNLQPSYSEAENFCVAMCGSDMGANSCPNDLLTWRNGNCSASVALGDHNDNRTITNTAVGYNGTLNVRCNAGEWVTREQGVCTPKPCAAGPATWDEAGQNCSAALPAGVHLDVFTANSTNGANIGTQQYQCFDGAWIPQGNGTCEALACPVGTVAWGSGCTGDTPQGDAGLQLSISNTNPDREGAADIRCVDNSWVVQPGATCESIVCPATSHTGEDDTEHAIPEMRRGDRMECGATRQTNGFLGIGRRCYYERIAVRCQQDNTSDIQVMTNINDLGRCTDLDDDDARYGEVGCPIDGTVTTPVDGECGPENGQVNESQPSGADACSSGAFADSADDASNFHWSCQGVNGGDPAQCSAPIDMTNQPPTITSFDVTPLDVVSGDPVQVSYVATNATRCRVFGGLTQIYEGPGDQGDISDVPPRSQTYTLRCFNGPDASSPSVEDSRYVTIDGARPVINEFNVTPQTGITDGDTVEVFYANVENATRCKIFDGFDEVYEGSGQSGYITRVVRREISEQGIQDRDQMFTLRCFNGPDASDPFTDAYVTVYLTGDRPIIRSFTVDPTSVVPGSSVTARYVVENATRCNITAAFDRILTNGPGSTGQVSHTPNRSMTYALHCFNGPSDADPYSTQDVYVTVAESVPVIGSFSVNPQNVNLGQQVSISYSGVQDATSCKIFAGLTEIRDTTQMSGTINHVPERSLTYTLRCFNGPSGINDTPRTEVGQYVTVNTVNPIIDSYVVNPLEVPEGQAVSISYASRDSTRCRIFAGLDQIYEGPGASGGTTHVPSRSLTYTLRCFNGPNSNDPRTEASEYVTYYDSQPVQPTLGSFVISPNPSSRGETISITYGSVQNATRCEISGRVEGSAAENVFYSGSGSNGSLQAAPTISGEFTLRCWNGSTSASPMAERTISHTVTQIVNDPAGGCGSAAGEYRNSPPPFGSRCRAGFNASFDGAITDDNGDDGFYDWFCLANDGGENEFGNRELWPCNAPKGDKPAPTIGFFGASPNPSSRGELVTLTYSEVENATRCVMTGQLATGGQEAELGTGDGVSGSGTATPTIDGIFRLTCHNGPDASDPVTQVVIPHAVDQPFNDPAGGCGSAAGNARNSFPGLAQRCKLGFNSNFQGALVDQDGDDGYFDWICIDQNDRQQFWPCRAPKNGVVAEAEISVIRANPPVLQAGQFYELSWTTTNAASGSCTLDGYGSIPDNGSVNLTAPTTEITVTHTIRCFNSVGVESSRSQTFSVENATPLPVITNFTVNASSVESGQSVQFSWFADQADTCLLTGSGAQLPAQGTANRIVSQSGNFTLTCWDSAVGPGTSDSAQIYITASQPVNGSCGSASGQSYPHDRISYAPNQQCSTGTPSNNDFPDHGETETWVCFGQSGGMDSPVCSASRALAPATAPTIQTFETVPTGRRQFNAGSTVTFTWDVAGAGDCFLSGSGTPLAPNGSTTRVLNSSQTFTLTCFNPSGTESSAASLFLTALQPVDGVCGSADGRVYQASRTGYSPDAQCSAGSTTNPAFPSQGGTIQWTCAGLNGGANSGQCSASREDPNAGPPVISSFTASPNPSTPGQSVTLSWNSSNSTRCQVTLTGYSFGQGGPTGSVNFTAQEADDGKNAVLQCFNGPNPTSPSSSSSRLIQVNAPINGACGTASGQTYPANRTGYSPDAQCASGTPSNGIFPAQGGTTQWVCRGVFGGTDSATCSANRLSPASPQAGLCGNANGQIYPPERTGYAPDVQCAAGTPTNTAFPAQGATASWVCSGVDGGGNSPQCQAARQTPPEPPCTLFF